MNFEVKEVVKIDALEDMRRKEEGASKKAAKQAQFAAWMAKFVPDESKYELRREKTPYYESIHLFYDGQAVERFLKDDDPKTVAKAKAKHHAGFAKAQGRDAAREAKRRAAYDPGRRQTCQICGRWIRSKSGKIAHHGYARPGNGYIHHTCYGSEQPPFEESNARIPYYQAWLENRRTNLRDELKAIQDGAFMPVLYWLKPTTYAGHDKAVEPEVCLENYKLALRYLALMEMDDLFAVESTDERYPTLLGFLVALQEAQLQNLTAEILYFDRKFQDWFSEAKRLEWCGRGGELD